MFAAAATTSKDSKDENFDSGISVDKSESTSSDDRLASTSNNVVHMALPREGVSAFFEMSRRSRKNYRKRKTPGNDFKTVILLGLNEIYLLEVTDWGLLIFCA